MNLSRINSPPAQAVLGPPCAATLAPRDKMQAEGLASYVEDSLCLPSSHLQPALMNVNSS